MKSLVTTFLTVLLIGITFLVSAAEPPKVGDQALEFTLKTLDGHEMTLSKLNASNQVVLIVLRGWPGYQCPICERQVHDFMTSAAKFADYNARVVMVYPGPADDLLAHAKEFIGNTSWPKEFVFLIDPDYTMVNAYGLRWDSPRETSYPSTFILAPDGKVRFVKISHTHGDRTKAADILKKLKATSAN